MRGEIQFGGVMDDKDSARLRPNQAAGAVQMSLKDGSVVDFRSSDEAEQPLIGGLVSNLDR
jgi:hypothetical protein